jgi:hypothetical protein
MERRFLLDQPPNPEWSAALAAFNEESALYCKGINDNVAREYAVEYARMMDDRLRGLDAQPPKVRHELFAPSRRWICSTLEEIRDKYFPAHNRT